MGGSINGGTPSHHPFEEDFPQQKASSYWGTSIYGNPHIVKMFDECV